LILHYFDLLKFYPTIISGIFSLVGGIKEKVIAAHRAGMKRVLLPKRNQKDVNDIPRNVKVCNLQHKPLAQKKPERRQRYSKKCKGM
jgi:hypothetical protein